MLSIPQAPDVASAAAVFCQPRGAVTRLARLRGASRQSVYRQAHAVHQAVAGTRCRRRLADLRRRLAAAAAAGDALRRRLRRALAPDAERQAEFAATAQALGVSLTAAHALLGVLLGPAAPSRARLGRLSRQAAGRAAQALAELDRVSRPRARQLAADEIFVGRRPVLVTVEQDSRCLLGSRLAAGRASATWAEELGPYAAAEQLARDGGQGLRKGLERVNAARRRAGQPPIADQEDHFHLLQRGGRAFRAVYHKARRASRKAEQARQALDRRRRRGLSTAGRGQAVQHWWRRAEAALDRWIEQERPWRRLQAALRLFSPAGELNSRARAEAEVQAALAQLTGPEWARLRRRLVGPEAFPFLDRVQAQWAAVPVAAELRTAAVRVEGLRRQPAAFAGDGPAARVRRGVLLASGLVRALAGPAGATALALVRAVLGGAWRSSSSAEGINSVLRMQQARQQRMTQGLLDLKRLSWNLHTFGTGPRKGQSPYQRLGLVLPPGTWWALLKKPPEQLRQELSALNPPP